MANRRRDLADWWKRIDRIISVKRNQVIILVTMSTCMLCVLVVFGVILFRSAGEIGEPLAKAQQPVPVTASQPQTATQNTILPSPTPPCTARKLILSTAQVIAKLIEPSSDGAYAIPAGSNSVYWYQNSAPGFVFSLSPSDLNIAMVKTIQSGDLITVSGANCSEESFTLDAPEVGASFTPRYAEQPGEEFVLFIRDAQEGQGVVVRGKRVAEQVIITDTPAPEQTHVEAEISLISTTTASNLTSIEVNISIKNTGSTAFQVRSSDIQVVPTGSGALGLTGAKPGLPKKIGPGDTVEFALTFARPMTDTAVLKIFDVEYDLEGY